MFALPVPTNQPVPTSNTSLFFSFSSPPLPPASLILPVVLHLLCSRSFSPTPPLFLLFFTSSSSSLRAARAKEFRLNFSEVLQGTLSSVSHPSVCVDAAVCLRLPPPDITRLNRKLSQVHLAPPLHVSRWDKLQSSSDGWFVSCSLVPIARVNWLRSCGIYPGFSSCTGDWLMMFPLPQVNWRPTTQTETETLTWTTPKFCSASPPSLPSVWFTVMCL